MKKKLFLSWLLSVVCSAGLQAQVNSIWFKEGSYQTLDELKDSSFSPFNFIESVASLGQKSISTFHFKNIQLKEDIDIEDIYEKIEKDSLVNIRMDSVVIDGTFYLTEYRVAIQLSNSKIKVLDLQGSNVQNVIISDCQIDTIKLDRSNIINLLIRSGKIDCISLMECHRVSSLVIDDHVSLRSLVIPDFRPGDDGKSFVKISCSPFSEADADVELLADAKTDFEKIDIDYQNFNLKYFEDENETTADEKRTLYHRVLKKFEENGQSDNYLRLYRHKKKYEASLGSDESVIHKISSAVDYFFSYKLPDWWWGFGFEKKKVLMNTLFLFLGSLGLGVLFFKWLLKEYPALMEEESLKNTYKSGLFGRFIISVVCTAILFFGIEFKANKMKFKNGWMAFLVIAIYLVGLVCLGFIANLIITV